MTQKIRLTETQLRGMIQEAVNAAIAQRKPMRNPNRLSENRLRNMIKESVKGVLRESGNPGSLIHGTHRNEDLIPTFMSEIFRNDPKKAREIWKSSPNLLQALCDKNAGIDSDWWDSEEATEICIELQDTLQEYAPEGYSFGTHMGDGSDFGYWSDEELDY